ncbi:uncharacterized protein [Aristolochia californica]|uniref:uncharacterized protein n=1 Tax=Aristolochia californica TaxID=171875 RepID=UPI0035DCE5A3
MEKWRQGETLSRTVMLPSFYFFTLAILSLLLPLSLLFLARLSTARQLLPFIPHPTLSSTIISFLVEFNPLCFTYSSSLSAYWPFSTLTALGVLQLCVGTGVEATIAAGVWLVGAGEGSLTWAQRALFFVELHEMTLFWSRLVVRPVVDDTVYGENREETAAQRGVTGAAFGVVWWWRLRDELEILGSAVRVKKEVGVAIEITDIVCLSLYYITVVMGVVRLEKGLVWVVKLVMVGDTVECVDSSEKV